MKSTRCSDHSSNLLRDCCHHPNKHPVINAFSLIVQAAWPALEEFFLPRKKNMHKRVSVMCGRGVLYVHSERRLNIATHGKITCEHILSVLHMLPPSIFLRTLEVDATVRSIFQKRKLSHKRDDSTLLKVIQLVNGYPCTSYVLIFSHCSFTLVGVFMITLELWPIEFYTRPWKLLQFFLFLLWDTWLCQEYYFSGADTIR